MTTASATSRALDRISVRPPYFALDDLTELGGGVVTAAVPSAPAPAPEVGAMEAAQVARHLAILGSCAAALGRDDDAQHHYLATQAHYTRMASSPTELINGDGGETLRAEAVASWVDRRTARAMVKLMTEAGHGLNLLDVTYTVLTPRMFARLHPDGPDIDPAGELSSSTPTGAGGEQPDEIDWLDGGVRVDAGPIPASLCAGHFPGVPAAPVAIVMGQLCRAAGLGLNHHLGLDDHRYRIEEGHVTASKLARAGQRLVLETRYGQPVRGGHELTGEARADGDVIGEVTVVMTSHAPNPCDQVCDDPALVTAGLPEGV